ncbi:MAG: sigma-70 family RNA polymerase sigma factor, partial [Verrucomicrobiae bacterium]|nr:sigma-70 family RNA polymerase sigma factor [Verrucomicrobiae bacterium]
EGKAASCLRTPQRWRGTWLGARRMFRREKLWYMSAMVVSGSNAALERGAPFVTTHWSLVTAAGDREHPDREGALEALCRAYWRPVYAYVRRRGNRPEDAQDLTQEFFNRLLAREWLAGVEPRTTRFRSFLLTAVSCFLANEYDRSTAQKRGGGWVAMELEAAECMGAGDPKEPAEHAFDHRWALDVMDQALARIREEAQSNGKLRQFEALGPFLSREPEPGEYGGLVAALGMAPRAIGVAVLRLRRRFREVVRSVLAETVCGQADVEEELKYLVEILRR